MDVVGEIKPCDTDGNTDEEIVDGVEVFEITEDMDSQSDSENHPGAIEIPKIHSEIVIDYNYVPPTSEMIAKIVAQVEYYFSDANLPNDKFLMQRIKRDKKGFVSVRLVNGFNRMKKLGASDTDVSYALKTSSTQLSLNSSGKKMKRISPLPQLSSPTDSCDDPLKKTVLAINLHTFTDDSIRQIFEQCGKVEDVQLMTDKSQISSAISLHTKKHFKFNPPEEWALVRYATRESAEKSCRVLTNTSDWRKGLRVSLLIAGNRKTDKNAKPDHREEKSKSRVLQLSRDESVSNSGGSDADSSGEGINIVKKGGGRRSGGKLGRSPLTHELDDSRIRSSSFDMDRPALFGSLTNNNSSSSSPWIQRRFRADQIGSSPNILSSSPLRSQGEGVKKDENVLRLPRGPEGRGFELKRCLQVAIQE